MSTQPLLCTRELNQYLMSILNAIKKIKQKGYNAPYLKLEAVDFITVVLIIAEERGYTIGQLQELEKKWDDICSYLEGYNYLEPLCYKTFDLGRRFVEPCIIQSAEQFLKEL